MDSRPSRNTGRVVMFKACIAAAVVALSGPAAAQLYKCVGPDGAVTYSDAGCPSSARHGDIKAAPIAGPTARDARAAEERRASDNRHAAAVERQRRIEAARPGAGAVALGGSTQARAPSPAARPAESYRCAGIQHQLHRGQFMDPLGFDRSLHAMELKRAEREHCRP